jgi:micrococcal nuclease
MLQYASILLLSVLLGAAGQPEPPPAVEAMVNRVVDGDTLDVQVNGIRTPIGLLGVETPQLNQPCGPEALARTVELVGHGLLLQADPTYSVTLDARRRVLFNAFTPDGASIAEMLVVEGLARATPDAPNAEALTALEQEAQANAAGCLWAS